MLFDVSGNGLPSISAQAATPSASTLWVIRRDNISANHRLRRATDSALTTTDLIAAFKGAASTAFGTDTTLVQAVSATGGTNWLLERLPQLPQQARGSSC